MIRSLLVRHEISQEIIHQMTAGNRSGTCAEEHEEEQLIDGKTETIEKGTELSKDDETIRNLNIVIATFIAGITFAAAVQAPGGYDDEGMANLKDKASFKFFLLFNSMGFGFAAGSLLTHFACEILPRILGVVGLQLAFTGSSAGFYLLCRLRLVPFRVPPSLLRMPQIRSCTTTSPSSVFRI